MRKKHWENIYASKQMNEVSWYQKKPIASLDLITELVKDKNEAIIDVGGGDGFLVDNLLDLGYTNITVLDISENAINRAKKRLGDKALLVNWVVSDINDYKPSQQFALWHDRAVFHFLTEDKEIEAYKSLINTAVNKHFILATFSDVGPDKCSGLLVSKYSQEDMSVLFSEDFTQVKAFNAAHNTPFDTQQNFTFSVFKRK